MQERRSKKWRGRGTNRKQVASWCIKPKYTTILLNINRVFTKIKKEIFYEWVEENTQLYAGYEMYFSYQSIIIGFETRGQGNIFHANTEYYERVIFHNAEVEKIHQEDNFKCLLI